ncbi:YL1-domain-containing protein [Meira miltonrushii]|uniref:YL1-domain-containing protein n=1 Tax=Meira miltonrushii TaxID=1280837 RepID=A0A316VC16_9BASI|nr:YL1-domain-containing protein [Meira miltonrushii]PWN34658.1 YL1-domain-containing protein [Meira miltonrushii]
MSDEDGDLDKMAGPSSAPAVEALSAGRSRRATAGNRMRELLEQERERIAAEGEDPSLSTSRKGVDEDNSSKKKKKKSGKSGEEDEDAIFQNEDDDVDFQELEGGEDIIDSDFDLSSDQGEDDEEAGERALEAEERAARRASKAKSKAKSKAIPTQVKRTALPPKSALANDGDEAEGSARPAKQKKRISFAPTVNGEDSADKRNQRSSKRKSAIEFSESVQARLKEDEERRARQMEHAQPKRKKVRLSQADLIAEALEMEEQNRQSLKVFLQGEEDRRERERKRGKKKMEGPFMRWRSVTIQYGDEANVKHRPHSRIEVIDANSAANVTQDPVFAARQAAIKEREARLAAEGRERSTSGPVAENKDVDNAQGQEAEPVSLGEKADTADAQDTMDVDSTNRVEASEISLQIGQEESSTQSTAGEGAKETETTNDTSAPSTSAVADSEAVALPLDKKDATSQENKETTGADSEQVDGKGEEAEVVVLKTEKEARAFLSLHELPSSTHWTTMFSYILGDHVDWSRYPYVNPRNRPLRPRISVCPITGLPAKYRDPRSGIPFANREAYANLTAIIKGEFRWSGSGTNTGNAVDDVSTSKSLSKKADQPKKLPRYDPMEMGCFLDRISEPGANNVRLRAEERLTTVNVIKTIGATASSSGYVPVNTLAPGDEQALMEAALALPAGTTRSGGRRSAAK